MTLLSLFISEGEVLEKCNYDESCDRDVQHHSHNLHHSILLRNVMGGLLREEETNLLIYDGLEELLERQDKEISVSLLVAYCVPPCKYQMICDEN